MTITLTIHLTEAERIKLESYRPPKKKGGGFQGLMVWLRDHIRTDVRTATGTITIPPREWTYQERFARYRSDRYGDGGWEGFLRRLRVVGTLEDGRTLTDWNTIAAAIYEGKPTQEDLFQ